MLIGSHNSWTYLKPKKWWMRLISFTARCQRKSIQDQYTFYGVRCFDLRVRFRDNGEPVFAHGIIEYEPDILGDLGWLNSRGDTLVRVVHEVRNKKQNTKISHEKFLSYCSYLEMTYPDIRFWGGDNLMPQDRRIYNFKTPDPKILELYSSVCPPKIIDDWIPWLYAKFHNRSNHERYKDSGYEIMLMDYVDIT